MNRRKAMMLAVLMVLGMGCPDEWSKGGFIDRAVAKDTRENLPEPELFCPEGQTVQWECPKDDPDPKKCRWTCR